MGAKQLVTPPSIPAKTETAEPKKEADPKEKENRKRKFLLNFNNYFIGTPDETKLDKLHNHVFQGDGDYVIAKNRIGKFIVKMRDAERPGLQIDYGKNFIKLDVPKIPKKIYYQTIGFFKDVMAEHGGAEAFLQVYYDTKEKEYIVHVPEQTVSGASVRYDAEKNLNETDRERYIFVFEIHSHNSMGAFWSGTDNADEKDTRFYGVFGKLDTAAHEERFRFFVLNKEVAVQRHHIFDFEEEVPDEEYPKEWLENVNKSTYTYQNTGTVAYAGHGTQGGNNYFGGKHQAQGDGVPYGGQGSAHWGYEDDYDDPWYQGQQRHYANNEKKSTTPSSSDLKRSYGEIPMNEVVSIDDTFNINLYEDDTHVDIIETFVSHLDEQGVTNLLEALVEFGHDPLLQLFQR